MKKIFLIMILTVSVMNVRAETLQYYDENGRLFKSVDGDSITVYTYNAQGKQETTKTYASESALLNNTPKETRVRAYNSDGRLETETAYKGEYVANSNMTPKFYYQYEYDENGKWVGRIQYKGGNVTRYNRYAYNDAGQTVSDIIYSNIENYNQGNAQYSYQYTYDSQGNRISRTRYENNETDHPSSQEEYTFDYDRYGNVIATYTNGLISSTRIYDPAYLNKQWLENHKRIYTIKEANDAAGKKNRVMIRYK